MADFLELPLVEALIKNHSDLDLAKVKIIGVQHILETTHAMFRALYKLGLKPENISLIGKCYSTCDEVYKEMRAEGIDVSPASFAYKSHVAYDVQFADAVKIFLSERLEIFTSGKYDRIIVLDDGGKCIDILSDDELPQCPIVAIEQTSSGYEAIRSKNLKFPVFNVARSPLKLSLESPMIAGAASERLFQSLQKRGLSPKEALIIGGGAIGKAMQERLSITMNTVIYDQNCNSSSQNGLNLPSLLKTFPLIIGCTGKVSVPHEFHQNLPPGATLVSVSSSDREFDAVYLRKRIKENTFCHEDLVIDDILLVRSGFPVNFDGERENIEPVLIQLTIALITAGILGGLKLSPSSAPRILPLCSETEDFIKDLFLDSLSTHKSR